MPPSPAAERSFLLARLDALTDLANRRHGLLLGPDSQLTRADAAAVAHALGIEPRQGGGVGLLLLLGIAVGVLRADRLRVRAAPLHDTWRQLDDTLRAGLVFAAWCQHATFPHPGERDRSRVPIPTHDQLDVLGDQENSGALTSEPRASDQTR